VTKTSWRDCSACGTRIEKQSGIWRCPKCGLVPRHDWYPSQERRQPALQEEKEAAPDYTGRRRELSDHGRRAHTRPLKFEEDD